MQLALAIDESDYDAPSFPAAAAVLALKSNQCRFPIGDTFTPGFMFCESTQTIGSSYCAHHSRVCSYGPQLIARKR